MECSGPLLKTGRGHIVLHPQAANNHENIRNILKYIIVSKSSGLMSFIAQIKVLGNTATPFMFATTIKPPPRRVYLPRCHATWRENLIRNMCSSLQEVEEQQMLFLQLLFGLLRQIMFLSQCSGKTALKCPNEALSWGYSIYPWIIIYQHKGDQRLPWAPAAPISWSFQSWFQPQVEGWIPNTPPSPYEKMWGYLDIRSQWKKDKGSLPNAGNLREPTAFKRWK